MSNKIKSDDIFDSGIFDILTTGAEEAQKKIALLNAELTKVGTSFKSELGGSKPTTIKEIESLISKTKELTDAVDKQTKVNAQQAELNKRNRLDEIRLQQAREKAVDDFNRKEQKENERAIKETEKRLKNERDLADSYKQLTINTRDLKNESKRLGAEMLELEKQGKKNSAEYYKLSRQYKETTKSAIEGDKALKKLDSTVGDNFRNVGNYSKAISGLRSAFMQLGLAFGAIDIIKSLVGTQVKLDSLNLALRNVSGSTKEYQSNLSFLKDLSLSYGQDLISLADSYKNFIASTQSSNLSLAQRKRIYESVIKAGSSLALSNDNIKGSLLAISQMFSKGTVSAEELRQQLGERLPGAFGVMADSMGVTEAELGKLMKEGKVLADEVMPRFAIALERSFGKNAEKNLETLNGAFNVLKTNIALYFDQAQKNIGVNKVLAGILRGLGNNIGGLLDNIRQLVVAFVSFKAISIASEISMKAVNTGLLTMIKNAWRGKEAFTLLGMSLKGLTGVAVMEVLIKLTEYFIGLAKGTDLATEAYMRYKNATDVGNSNADKFIDKQRHLLAIERERLDKLKEAGKINDEQHKKLMKQKDDEVKANIKGEIQTLRGERSGVVSSMLQIEKKYKDGKVVSPYTSLDEVRALSDIQSKARFAPTKAEMDALMARYDKIKESLAEAERYSKLKAKRIRIDTEMPSYFSELRDMEVMNTKYTGGAGTPPKGTLEHTKELRDLNVEYNKTNVYLSRQLEILKDIEEINAQNKLQETIDKTTSVLKQEEKNVNMTGKYNAGLVEIAVNTEYEARKEHEIKAFKKIEEDKKIRDKKTFDDELESVKEQEKNKMDDLMEINSDYYRRLNDYRKSIKEPNLSSAKQKELKKEAEWLEGERKDIELKTKQIREGANKEEIQVYKNKIEREKDTNLEIEGLTEAHEGKLANIKRDSQTKIDEELAKLELIRAEKRLEMIKNTAESVNNLIQKSLEHYINMAERRIDMLDKRMDRMSTQADFLREKAVAGNIQAQESLAVIDKQEIEAQKERMNEQRSIQKLQMAMAVFQAYSNNIQNAKVGENPFTKTLTDVTLLSQFINSLPTFIDGTETNIASALGKPHLQGQDGYLVRVDGSEKVLNPQLSAMTGNMTTMEIAKLAEDFRRGDIMRKGEGAMQLNVGSWGTDMIVSKLESLEQTIKNKPENKVEVAEILNGVMHIVETKKSGNTKVRNISRFS
jgi:tape measure domain-containing protein